MKKLVKVCDDLWAKLVKKRARHVCEKCGKAKGLQSHHIIPRTNMALRHDPENGVCLCIAHHLYWAHKDAIEFTGWIETMRDMDYLKLRRHQTFKGDYELVRLKLLQQLDE